MKPTRSPKDDIEELRRNGDPRLSEDAKKILREITRGPELARELAALAEHDPDLAGWSFAAIVRIVDEYVALRVVVYDVLLPAATHEEAGTLLSLFGPAERNTYRRRRWATRKHAPVEIDIPCDVQQIDSTGFVWTLLDEARDPSLVTEGAIVVAADEIDPVVARVVDLVRRDDRTIVHLEIPPGDPLDYADALTRAHIAPASRAG